MILADFSPLWSGTLAYTIAAIFYFLYLNFFGIKYIPSSRKIFFAHCISALLFLAVNITGLYGVKMTLAGRASIFIFAHPLFVALFAGIGKKGEKISKLSALGLFIAFAGVLVVYGDRLKDSGASQIGDLLMILSSALLALMIVHVRNLSRQVGAKEAVFWQITLALPVFWFITILLEEFPTAYGLFSLSGLFYQALAVNFLGFLWLASLIEKYTANSITSFFFLTPVVAVILSYILLDEPMNLSIILGGLIVGVGVLMNVKGTNIQK